MPKSWISSWIIGLLFVVGLIIMTYMIAKGHTFMSPDGSAYKGFLAATCVIGTAFVLATIAGCSRYYRDKKASRNRRVAFERTYPQFTQKEARDFRKRQLKAKKKASKSRTGDSDSDNDHLILNRPSRKASSSNPTVRDKGKDKTSRDNQDQLRFTQDQHRFKEVTDGNSTLSFEDEESD
jgi:hypothetical protein